jgi:hypothetical protein
MTAWFLEAVHANPWGDEFVDLPALNASASDAIETAIRNVRETARTKPTALRSTCLTVLGPAGAGKTHLFGRLRARLGPRAVFVHIRPLVGTEMTPRFVLHEIVRQLGFVSGEVRQIDALVGALVAHGTGNSTGFPRFFIEDTAHLEPKVRAEKLEGILSRLLETWQELDEGYLRCLLAVPFQKSPSDRALLSWLSGRELDAVQLERAGATAALGEEIVVPALKSLAAAASVGAPIVVVFDQLENLIDRERESSRLFAYAQLTTDLVDTVHGLVIVQMALDTEWDRGIEPSFNLAQRSRLGMHRHLLGLPTPKEREDLLRLWVDRLPDKPQPFPWPLGERLLARFCGEAGMTPRMLLIALRQALDEGPVVPTADGGESDVEPARDAMEEENRTGDALSATWDEYLSSARRLLDEVADQKRCIDPWRLTDAILSALRFVPGVEPLDVRASRPAQVRIVRGSSEIHVSLLHQPHHKSIGAALTKLLDLARTHEVVVVREGAQEFPPTWSDTIARRSALLREPKAQWLSLEREDAARLLALDEMLRAARSRDITDHAGRALEEDNVSAWLRASLDVASWTLSKMLRGERTDQDMTDSRDASAPTGRPSSGLVLSALTRLRLLSLDRLMREIVRVEPSATRASILSELDSLSDRVRWVGRSIVYLREES